MAEKVIEQYKDVYPELEENREKILSELNLEEERFQATIRQGMKSLKSW